MTTTSVLAKGTRFMWSEARLLERKIFACRFEDGSPADVVTALRPYQNWDGGFGNGLEPDLRAPESQPICVELALEALCVAGVNDESMVSRACGFLSDVADENGAVSPSLPGSEAYPCADHWGIAEWAHAPAVNPTAAIAARLFEMDVQHVWRRRATDWCLGQIESRTFESAHTLLAASRLIESLPDLGRAKRLLERIGDQLKNAEWFAWETPVTAYAQTPLHFAPRPDAFARALFSDETIEAHLDDLIARQDDDGGWPVLWNPPGPAATAEWRGRWTLDALLTLRAYGRI